MKSRLAVLISLFVLTHCSSGCGSRVVAPTATDVAITAVNTTDTALQLAITALPDTTTEPELKVWGDRVVWVEAAASAVRESKDVCLALPALVAVAEGIKCVACLPLITAAQKELKCLP